MYDLLKGARVLDLTSVVLGPFATQYLGDFGADVIKVEPPAGDIFRYVRPARNEDMGAGFMNFNRNKRSACLNLKDESDLAQFRELLLDADVLVHNMRPAAAARLGLSPEEARKQNPRLIYCAAPGFGSRGRNADNPAYDDIIQAASGVAVLNQTSEGEPRFLPTVLCDKVGGMHLAMAVLAGLTHQAKTGKGCVIETPMFEGMVAFMMPEHLSGETFRPADGGVGYERLLSPYRRPYKTKDGFIGVLPYNGEHWRRALTLVGSDLAEEPWVQSSAERSARVGQLYAIIDKAMPSRTTEDWLTLFANLDIPCTSVNSLEDLLVDEHLADVGFFAEVEHPSEGAIKSVRSPFWIDGVDQKTDAPAPRKAQTNEPIAWKVER